MAAPAFRQLAAASAAFAAVAGLPSATDRGWLADADRLAFEAIRERRIETATRVARAVSALAEPSAVYPTLAFAGVAAARKGNGGARACHFWSLSEGHLSGGACPR
jgi:hypothetical protein